MFTVIISPFWLVISVLYFGLGVFHYRLSKWGSNALTVPGKNELFSGGLAEFLESEFIRTAYLTKIVLKFAALGFFVASIISFFQSVTVDLWMVPADDWYLVVTVGAFFAVLLVVWRFVGCIDFRTRRKTNQITLPWFWYDEKKGNTFDRVSEPSWKYFEAKVGGESVLLAATCFTVPRGMEKFPVDLKEGITLNEKVSGELIVSDAGLALLEMAYYSKLEDITLAELFEDRATHSRLRWELSKLKPISFEKSSKKFSFEAIAKLLFPDTSTPPQPTFDLCVEKGNAS
jgi:hypothetical protein